MTTNQIRFQSTLNPSKYCFVLNKDWQEFWDQVRRRGAIACMHEKCGVYETYGDGMVQHAPAFAAPTTMIEDYCISLVRYLKDHPTYLDFATEHLISSFKCNTTRMRGQIVFFRDMRYIDTKPFRYFSVDGGSYLKISSSESKRHDKRWTAIPSDADGTDKFVWKMLECNYNGSLHGWYIRNEFTTLCRENDVWVSDSPLEWLGIEKDTNRDSTALALRCLWQTISGHSMTTHAGQTFETYMNLTKESTVNV